MPKSQGTVVKVRTYGIDECSDSEYYTTTFYPGIPTPCILNLDSGSNPYVDGAGTRGGCLDIGHDGLTLRPFAQGWVLKVLPNP